MKRQNFGDSYIYSITVHGRIYIGQTEAKSGTPRVFQHITKAYRNERQDVKKTDLYDRMRQVRIMDLDIQIYPAPDYGIPGFDDKYNQFCEQWIPASGRLIKGGKTIEEQVSRIDFAEIYHTMWAVHSNQNYFNKEMGGKVRSLAFAGSTDKLPLLTAKTPPREAYNAFLRGPEIYNEIAKETIELYKYVFSSDWPENIEKRLNAVVKNKEARLTWTEYCEQKLFPKFAEWTVENINNLELAQDKFQAKVRKHIKEHFIEPRNNAIKALIEKMLITRHQGNQRYHFSYENLDTTKWAQYLSKAFRGLLKQVKDHYEAQTKGSKLAQNIKTMVPVRITMSWKTDGKNRKQAPWLSDAPQGIAVNKASLQYESYLLFNYMYNQCEKVTQLTPYVTNVFSPEEEDESNPFTPSMSLTEMLGKSVVYMPFTNLRSLSAKMRDEYSKYCPAYSRNWLEFYQPMVAAWRRMKRKEPFEQISLHDNNYQYYETDEQIAVVYKMKNPILFYDLESLKIY